MTWRIFCLGTNNWQGGDEFAPGSGILHESHHTTLNKMPGVECFSVWPSKTQRRKADDYRIFELEHDIPICESVSPVSSYRWHAMSEEEFTAYRTRLRDFVEDFLADIESSKGPVNLFIAHHTFLNPVIMNEINDRREAAGKPRVPLCVFAHGTALKMYQNEAKKLPDFPTRFYPMVRDTGIFDAKNSKVHRVFVVASRQKEIICEVFPTWLPEKVTVSPCGFNDSVFKPAVPRPTIREAIEGLKTMRTNIPMTQILDEKGADKLIVFTGKFADWKRQDVVLKAAQTYEKSIEEAKGWKVLTVIVGTGPEEDQIAYLALCDKLGLQRTFFVGPHGQDVLCRINSAAELGLYPSRDEPFGLVLLECMACGTPVIGANSGGPKDYVTPDVGFLIDEHEDHDVLAANLAAKTHEALVENWRETKGPVAAKKAIDGYSLLAHCELILRNAAEAIGKSNM